MSGVGRVAAGICRLSLVVAACSLTLAACGKKEQAASHGQVVARVGDEVVTVPELENELRLANIPAEKQKQPAVIKQVLGEIVTRKYLAQQAVNAKLDREPGVLLEILRARSQVLASAYLGRAVAAKPVTQADVDKYIASNPLKFENRLSIATDQMTFPLVPGSQAVIDASKDATSLEDVDQRLLAAGIPHGRSSGVFTSGDIPEDLLNLIQSKKGDNVFFARVGGGNGVFFKVVGETPSPLKGEAAQNFARQNLRADRLKAEAGLAAFSANLEAKYEGDYASIMKDTPPSDHK